MPVEQRPDGTFVFGYLDTESPSPRQATDTVVVRTGGDSYRAEMRPYRFGALPACDITGEQQVRILPRISPATSTHHLGLLLSGHGELEQDGQVTELDPGDIVLYTSARPFRLEFPGAYRYFVMNVAAVAGAEAYRAAGGALTGRPSGGILAAMVAAMAQAAAGLGPLSRCEMGDHVTAMLGTLLRESAAAGIPAPRTPAHERILDGVLDDIDRRLAEPLTPAGLAAGHHISVRHLHALFHKQGESLGDHIRRRRLDRIRRDLVDPGFAHLPVATVAARWGLHDPSHFGKVFRAEYGQPPTAYRRQALER